MMHNVNTAVQQADVLLVIVDATSNLAEVLEMPGMAPGWTGPPAALVSPARNGCACSRSWNSRHTALARGALYWAPASLEGSWCTHI